jgi:predicted transcriptional regulator
LVLLILGGRDGAHGLVFAPIVSPGLSAAGAGGV